MTRCIQSAERDANATLFERNRSKIELTDAGRSYVEFARISIASGERAMRSAKESREGADSVLQIGKSPDLDPVLVEILYSIRLPLFPAMPALTAERLCPGAVFIPPDFVCYKEASRAIRGIFERHTDLIEPLSLDEAYLDVTENKTGLPTATLVAKTIRQQIRAELNLIASAGVGPNKFLAKIASDWKKPDGLWLFNPTKHKAFSSR